jgi:hypothetical protein
MMFNVPCRRMVDRLAGVGQHIASHGAEVHDTFGYGVTIASVG